jgi:acyl dehydratase
LFTHLANPQQLLDQEPGHLGTSDWLLVNQDRINGFARYTEDYQWIHVDPERAKHSPFGTTIAHGYLTLALAPLLLRQIVVVDEVDIAVICALDNVRFPAPVPANSRIRGCVQLISATSRDACVEAVFEVTVDVENGVRPACIAELSVLYS